QIRGRVGRSRERAYAYLLYDSARALTPEAAQRLSALSDYTELGAGFQIAMRDLEIRGAGNLLGDEQSGHVAALGFELYMQMLDEAVREGLIRAGEAGARTVSFRGDRLAVVPIELDSARARRLRERLPEAVYESGRSQVSVRVPSEGSERFPTVVRAADVLLAVMREAA